MEIKSLDYYVRMEEFLGKKGNGRKKNRCSRYARIYRPLMFPLFEQGRQESYELALLYLRFHPDFDELSVNDQGKWVRHHFDDEHHMSMPDILRKIKSMASIASKDRLKRNFLEAKFLLPGTEDDPKLTCIGFMEYGNKILTYEAAVHRGYENMFTIREDVHDDDPHDRPLYEDDYAYTDGLWVPDSFDEK